jgi:1-deoxy-D-xylulose-5-phosphate synthase
LGFATARDLAGKDHKVVAVIGDGSMTGGLAFEAMNNLGSMRKNMLVILNDNTWSISKNVGSLSTYLTKLMTDERMLKLRSEIWELTGKFKRRDRIRETIVRVENSLKSLLVPGQFFAELGFKYFGPIDGHDIPALVRTLEDLNHVKGPILLHIATVKGKGYTPAEGDAFKYHGVSKFDKVTGTMAKGAAGNPSYTKIFGDTMVELAMKNKQVVAVTAAMSSGTGLVEYAEKFPDRFFDVGIAEAHASCFAAGLAAEGVKPYVAIYSTFLQRAYDQLIHDMGIQNLPVTICMDRAGVVGNDGPTHHGVFDIAYLSTIPNLTLAAPKDGNEFRSMLHHTADQNLPGITAIRYPRDNSPVPMTAEVQPIEWGKWEWITEPSDCVMLASGTMVAIANETAAILATEGISLGVVNARFLKPYDQEMLDNITRHASVIFTAEEGQRRGGFGQGIADHLLSAGYIGRFKLFAIPDAFVTHGDREELMLELGLTPAIIAREIRTFLAAEISSESEQPKRDTIWSRLVLRNRDSRKQSA